MMNFDDLFDSIFEGFNSSPMYFTTLSTNYPTETKDVINATVDSPLAFNLTTDSDKDCTLELAMAGVKKENLKISKKGRTFTITCVGVENTNNDKKVAIFKKGLKVPSDKDVISTFTVPETFNVEKATFDYKDGLLTIVVPLRDEEMPIDIKLD